MLCSRARHLTRTVPLSLPLSWLHYQLLFGKVAQKQHRLSSRLERVVEIELTCIKQLLDEVEHDIMNYQNPGLCYLPKRKAEADNTDTRF